MSIKLTMNKESTIIFELLFESRQKWQWISIILSDFSLLNTMWLYIYGHVLCGYVLLFQSQKYAIFLVSKFRNILHRQIENDLTIRRETSN